MMLTRALMPATAVLLAALAAGCASSGSSVAAPPAPTASATGPAAAASASAVASVAAGTPSPAASASVSTAPVGTASASPVATGPAGADVYLAESQDPNGTTVYEPGCHAGCPLSGDGTTVLWDMTWPTWNGDEAVGAGTEKIDGCNPDCAAGPEYSVAVTVTFTQPVKDCADGGKWFWTHASFAWPQGLPTALQGDNAPLNPWDFTQLRTEATQTCG